MASTRAVRGIPIPRTRGVRSGIDVFARVGERIARAWKACGDDAAAFGDIACEALAWEAPCTSTTPHEIIEWSLRARDLPAQAPSSEMADLAIPLYAGVGFAIDAVFSNDDRRSIRNYPYSGAFHILSGEAIECTYAFATTASESASLVRGELEPVEAVLLAIGATRKLPDDDRAAHSLVRLGAPTVTIIARTEALPGSARGFEFLRDAGIAYRSDAPDAALGVRHEPGRDTLRARLRIVDWLRQSSRTPRPALVRPLIDRGDADTAFRVALTLADAVSEPELRAPAPEVSPHDALIAAAYRARDERARTEARSALRSVTRDEAQRVILGILLAIDDPPYVLDLVAQAFPDCEPFELLVSEARAIATASAFEDAHIAVAADSLVREIESVYGRSPASGIISRRRNDAPIRAAG